MTTPIVRFRNVSKTFAAYSRREAEIRAISDVTLDVLPGEVYGIIGYSGAGKSTLVRLVNALERATEGTIEVDGREITGLPERDLRQLRLGIGMIFQQFNLFNSKTVWGNVEYPLIVAGVPRAERDRRVSDLLTFVGLGDKAAAYPDQISGGQKQRVGIARALATSPSILLADEATSALDPETTQEVLALLRRVNQEFGTTIIVITHEMEVIKSIAHRVAVMEHGRVIEERDVFDLFTDPRTDAARRFVGTLVSALPEGEELVRLRERHPGRIVTVSVVEGSAQAEIFAEFTRHGVVFELVFGGINDVQGRTFGLLTLALTGTDADIDAAIGAVSAIAPVTEAS